MQFSFKKYFCTYFLEGDGYFNFIYYYIFFCLSLLYSFTKFYTNNHNYYTIFKLYNLCYHEKSYSAPFFYFSFPMFVFLLFLDQTSDLWYTFGDGDVDPEGIDKILLTKIWIPNLILPIWIWFTLQYLDSVMKKKYASRVCF